MKKNEFLEHIEELEKNLKSVKEDSNRKKEYILQLKSQINKTNNELNILQKQTFHKENQIIENNNKKKIRIILLMIIII